ncbi:MAG: phage tail tape measure protein [Brevibacillus sp.]|nr:phage tail tape measure protein [Brevibacillus sp.]
MATDMEVGNLVAKISLDDTGINKSMAELNRSMKLVQSEFQAASAKLGDFGKSAEGLKARADSLAKQIGIQQQIVEKLRAEHAKAAAEKGEDAKQTQNLEIRLNKAQAALAKMETELKQVNKELADQPSRMANWSKSLQEVGDRLQNVGQEIATSFGAAGAALTAALGFAVNTAADFEAQMSRVGAIAGASTEQLRAMSDTAMELGASTSKSASEVAQGMELMAAMGFEVNEIISAMPGVIAAAEASGEDMALVADTVAAALNAFGLEAKEASRVADVLAQSANSSAASVQDLSYTFKYAAPVAKALGISMEELAAAAGIMADSGIRGEQAGTTLRAALLRLADPPREAANKLRDLGVSITDAQGNMVPFEKIIAQLRNSLQGVGDAQKAAALSTIFGTEAVTGMLSVIEAGPERLRALTTELQNAAGASAEAAAKMKDNLKGTLEELGGAFETMQIAIGNALIPIIRSLAEAVQSVIDWFNQLSPSTQQLIAVSAAAGAALLTLVGALGGVLAVVGLAASGFGALGISLATVSAAILPVTAAIAGLTAAGVLLYQNWDAIKAYAIEVWDSISGYVQPVVDEIASFIRETFEDLAEWWRQVWPDLKQAFVNIWDGILAVVTPIVNAIVELMQWAWPFVKDIILGVWENIKGIITGALDVIMGLVNTFAGLFTGNWDQMWGGIKQMVSGAWQAIWNYFQVWGIGKVLGLLGKFAGDFLAIFKKIWDEAWSILTGLLKKVWGWVSDFAKIFIDLAKKAWEWGKNIVEGLWNGISSLSTWIRDKVTQFVESIGSTIREFFGIASPSKLMQQYGQYIAEGLALGIEQNQGRPVSAADNMANAINSALGKLQEGLSLTAQIAEAEFNLLAAKMQESGNESELLKAKYEMLTTQMEVQNERVALLQKAYEDMKLAKGATAEETQKLYLELLKEQEAQAKLSQSLQEVANSYKNAASAKQSYIKIGSGGSGWGSPGWEHGGDMPGAPDWLFPNGGGGSGGGGGSSGDDGGKSGIGIIDDIVDWLNDKSKEKQRYRDEEGSYRIPVDDKIRKLPGLATGGTVTRSGWTLVGERGPELLRLPRAAQVIPNYELPRLGGVAIDYDRLAQALARHMKPSITQYNTFTSPKALTPSETARKNLQVSRQLALEWGL